MNAEQLEQWKRFESLPDDAVVDENFTASLLGVSIWTVRRDQQTARVQLSARRFGRRVGDLRRKLRGEPATTATT